MRHRLGYLSVVRDMLDIVGQLVMPEGSEWTGAPCCY